MLNPEAFQFVNHSCNPNLAFDVDAKVVRVLRNIDDGEEFTFFYPSTEWSMHERYDCQCGSSDCIRYVTGAAHLSNAVLSRYPLSRTIRSNLTRRMEAESHPSASILERPIAIVHIDEFGNDPERFYDEYGFEPVIVRGAFEGNAHLADFTLDRVEKELSDQPLHVFNWETQQYYHPPAREIISAIRDGSRTDVNVVDHSIVGTPLGINLEPPAFLKRSWFSDTPGWEKMDLSLVLSPANAFTRLHIDSYGMQGWMYLIAGRKHWTLYPPKFRQAVFDPVLREFFHSRRHSPERFPLAQCITKYVGDLGAGELLFFPAGWAHEVSTSELSLGIGGSLLNEFQIDEHVDCWLWERTIGLAGVFDLQGQLSQRLPELSSRHAPRAASAFEFCQRWEARQRELAAESA
jgi:hypothetical protein